MKPTPQAVIQHVNNQIRMDNLIKGIVELSPILQADILADNTEVMDLREEVERLEGELDEANYDNKDLKQEIRDLEIEVIKLRDQLKARAS